MVLLGVDDQVVGLLAECAPGLQRLGVVAQDPEGTSVLRVQGEGPGVAPFCEHVEVRVRPRGPQRVEQGPEQQRVAEPAGANHEHATGFSQRLVGFAGCARPDGPQQCTTHPPVERLKEAQAGRNGDRRGH